MEMQSLDLPPGAEVPRYDTTLGRFNNNMFRLGICQITIL